jgi:hypothetical protein
MSKWKKMLALGAALCGMFLTAGEAVAIESVAKRAAGAVAQVENLYVARPVPCFFSIRSESVLLLVNASTVSEIDWSNGIVRFNSGKYFTIGQVVEPTVGYQAHVSPAFENSSNVLDAALHSRMECRAAKADGLANFEFAGRALSLDPKMIDYVASVAEGSGERARFTQVVVGPGIYEKTTLDSTNMGIEIPRSGLPDPGPFVERLRSRAGSEMGKMFDVLIKRGLVWTARADAKPNFAPSK